MCLIFEYYSFIDDIFVCIFRWNLLKLQLKSLQTIRCVLQWSVYRMLEMSNMWSGLFLILGWFNVIMETRRSRGFGREESRRCGTNTHYFSLCLTCAGILKNYYFDLVIYSYFIVLDMLMYFYRSSCITSSLPWHSDHQRWFIQCLHVYEKYNVCFGLKTWGLNP